MTTVKSLQLPQHSPQAAPSLAPQTPRSVSPARTLLSVVMVVLGSVVTTLDLNMTNPSLSQEIQGSLAFTPDESTWITVAYNSATLMAIALGGWLTQSFSRRQYLIVSLLLFVGCSLACAVAWDLTSLITFRTVQGFISGTFTYSAFNMVLMRLPRAKQHLGFVMVSITTGLPVPIGQFLAGWIDDNAGWQYIYYISAILGLLVIAGIRRFIDPEPMHLSTLKQVDWLGTFVLAIAVISFVTMMQRGNTENWFDSELIVGLGVVSLLLGAIFCWIELHQPKPLIDLRLLGKLNFALANVFNLIYGFVLSYSFILPQYLGQIQRYNPVQVSSVLIWSSLVNPTVAKIIEHFETRLVLAVGTSIFLVSCFMNATLDYNVSGYQLVWSQIVRALGQPMMGAVLSFAATENIKKEQANDATAIYNILRTIATTTANASIGTLLIKREQFHSSIVVDTVSMYNRQTLARLQQLTQFFTLQMGDPIAAQSQALNSLQQSISQQSYLMAYSDCFYFIGMAVLLGGIVSIPFLKVKKPSESVK